MLFRLVSQQLTFEEGEVSMVPDLASPDALLPSAWATVGLRSNETEEVPNVAPGEIQLLFPTCLVRSRTSNAARPVRAFQLTTLITEKEIAAGVAQVTVGFHAFVRVEAVDSHDAPLVRDHVFGVCLPGVSLEVNGPAGSPLHVLLPPGEYLAYLAGRRPVQVPFVVREHEEDAGTVTLRESATDDSLMQDG